MFKISVPVMTKIDKIATHIKQTIIGSSQSIATSIDTGVDIHSTEYEFKCSHNHCSAKFSSAQELYR